MVVLPEEDQKMSVDLVELERLFYVYKCFACMYVCVSHACLVPAEVKRGHLIPWN